jgi:2-polyprenyl-3-methyl-5-hydroxy-6-metoxy-1,4-benzoquinol methylase
MGNAEEENMSDNPILDSKDLNQDVRRIWDRNAAFWDDKMGEGNQFQRLLVAPATEHLLKVRPGQLILDVACGNGAMARRLAQLGANVVACDFAPALIERARARSTEYADRIEYHVVDATDRQQLMALGERKFDAAICNMALMDMMVVEPLFSAMARLLKPQRHFIFSVMHPCFNSSGTKLVIEEEDREGKLVTSYSVKVTKYVGVGTTRGLALVGQPEPQYYFHRTISTLLTACFHAGFVLDGIEEPVFDRSAEPSRPFSWANYHEIPPVLVARARLVSGTE